MTFTVLPAIDVREGQVVRLSQGDYDRQTTYGASPLETMAAYGEDGALWVHLVDLDAARQGAYTLAPLVRAVVTRTRLKVQTGGGVRTATDVENILAAGADRVVVGTLAVKRPELVAGWISKFGADHITVALDTRQDESGVWRLPVSGWTEVTLGTLDEFLSFYTANGLRHLLCTDISRDGMMSGFNVELYRRIATVFPTLELQASGGVRSLDDIRAAREAGAKAAILGRALLEKRFELKDALVC